MFDNSLTSNNILEEVFSSNTQIEISGIKVDIRLIGRWDVWQEQLLTASDNAYDAVFFGLYHTLNDKNGEHIPAEKAIGALVLFGYEQGKLAAEMAKEVLPTGIQPYMLNARTAEKGRYLFSRNQLKKYGFTLPKHIA